jgi:hypothetical protein
MPSLGPKTPRPVGYHAIIGILFSVFFLALLSCLGLFASTASAQGYVFGRADFAVGAGPAALAQGDFNGDGKLDLVVANRSDNTVSILLGKPDGTFSSKIDYATGFYPTSVVTGDFNGDGNLDIAVANGNCAVQSFAGLVCTPPGSLSILLGNGDGTFQPHVDYATGTGPFSVAIGDFNGDGKLDLVTANNVDSTVSILLGNGDGSFGTHVDYATARGAQSVIVADFNGDSRPDLAVGVDGQVSVLLGNGDGTFQSHADTVIPSGSGFAFLSAGDFNGDGKIDLAVLDSELAILLGNGDGTFVPLATYALPAVAVTSADLNGDGKLDLVIANQTADSVSVLLGNGDGTFQPPTDYGTASQPSAITVGDFNRDGRLDLAVADANAASVSVLLGLARGSFVGHTDYPTGSGSIFVTSADLNGDGKLDLAVANQAADSVSILLGNGDGRFQSARSFSTGHLPIWVVAGDFNGDGKMDLVVVNESCAGGPCNPGSVSVLLGNGDGTFQPHVDYPLNLDPVALAIGDFNGDGKVDLAVVNFGQGAGNTVSILLGNGDGTFRPHVDYVVAGSPIAVETRDFNGDGKADLAVAALNTVSVLLGKGDGTFQARVDYPTGSPSRSLTIGDFNGDGKSDLAVGTPDQAVAILLGNGDGTFRPAVRYPTLSGTDYLVDAGDFNGDGKLDLVVGLGGSRASILIGNGDGAFRRPVSYLVAGNSLFSVAVGDFDRDGGLDLAAADHNTDTVAVTLNKPFKAVYPTALNFGSQGVGTTSAVRAVTLTNVGGTSFSVGGIAVAGDYVATNTCGTSLSPAASCTINIAFSPTVTGVRAGTITITDSTESSPQVIPLTGSGVNGPFLSLSPSNLRFGSQDVGTTAALKSVMLANTGNATLSIASILVAGANSADFKQTNTCGSSLSEGSNCIVSVTFTPKAGGTRAGTITIADNAPGSPQSLPLSGIGIAPAPAVTFSPTAVTFASQLVSTKSAAQMVILTSNGTAPLTISSVAINGPNSGEFAQTNTCPGPGSSLAAGAGCTISVTFTPTSTGNQTASVTITDNATGSPQVVSLSGVGTDFSMSIASGGSTSATATAGQPATYNLQMSPAGGFSGTISLTCTGAPAQATCTPSPAILNLGGSSPTPFAVNIITTARSTAPPFVLHELRTPGWPSLAIAWLVLLALLLGSTTLAKRSRQISVSCVCTILFLSAVTWLVVACGGSGSSNTTMPPPSGGTPSGSYTLVVTGKSGGLSHSVNLTLKVN